MYSEAPAAVVKGSHRADKRSIDRLGLECEMAEIDELREELAATQYWLRTLFDLQQSL